MMIYSNWHTVQRWRRMRRANLLATRLGLTGKKRVDAETAVLENVNAFLSTREDKAIGFYWPSKAEVDVRYIISDATVFTALPVVVACNCPLEFWYWRPGMAVRPGDWNNPVPVERSVICPSLLLVPLLGFDEDGYRLGNGSGYYDRTIAAMTPHPYTVGVGFEHGRLKSIYPQSHDIPLDAIVTEAGVRIHCTGNEDDAPSAGFQQIPSSYMHSNARSNGIRRQ